jgi:ribose 5-phosphate isomerase B
VTHVASLGHEPVDLGPHVYQADDDYPPFCVATGIAVLADPGSLGVVIGGSGNGEQIAANKVPGIRAALAWSEETAQLARLHNDAQVVAIGARMHAPEEAARFVTTFLATEFSGEERHARRIHLLDEYQRTGIPPALPPSS